MLPLPEPLSNKNATSGQLLAPDLASAPAFRCWLVKFAPFRTSWTEIVRRGGFTPRGVRSPLARNNLAAMRLGDRVLFYHSQQDLAVVGELEVLREAYPDPSSNDSKWLTCDFRPVQTLPRPVPLSEIKAHPSLATLPLVRQPRLAVMPVSTQEFRLILDLSAAAQS
jgi:predicted RNA-binding protein with PUA-like domain